MNTVLGKFVESFIYTNLVCLKSLKNICCKLNVNGKRKFAYVVILLYSALCLLVKKNTIEFYYMRLWSHGMVHRKLPVIMRVNACLDIWIF